MKRRKRRAAPPKNLAADRKGVPGFGAYAGRYIVWFLDGTAMRREAFDAMIKGRKKC